MKMRRKERPSENQDRERILKDFTDFFTHQEIFCISDQTLAWFVCFLFYFARKNAKGVFASACKLEEINFVKEMTCKPRCKFIPKTFYSKNYGTDIWGYNLCLIFLGFFGYVIIYISTVQGN